MRTLVVNNTKAGAADGAIFDFIRLISDEDTEVVVRNLGPSLTTSQALTDAADFDLVVASGGDGTLASVSYELRNTGTHSWPSWREDLKKSWDLVIKPALFDDVEAEPAADEGSANFSSANL